MIIRAGIEYAKGLSQVGAETFIDSHKDSAPPHEIERYVKERYSIETIRKELSDPGNIYHILERDNKIIGFSKMVLNSAHVAVTLPNTSKMDQVYLLNSFHGLKLGALLLKHNIEFSKSHGQKGMWLIVWVGNKQAITFYEKFGFHIIVQGDFQLTNTHTSPCYIMLLNYASPSG
jgi:ribosomal protein S18 acetylase RimI-like enzyme